MSNCQCWHIDFELDGGQGRCLICTQGSHPWMKLGNLRAHEKQKTHTANAERVCRLEAEQLNSHTPRSAKRRYQTTVEDVPEDTDIFGSQDFQGHSQSWFEPLSLNSGAGSPPVFGSDGETSRNSDHLANLPEGMREALSGAVNFSAGDDFATDSDCRITLEDVLSGAGLFDMVADDDETGLLDKQEVRGISTASEDVDEATGCKSKSKPEEFRWVSDSSNHFSISAALC